MNIFISIYFFKTRRVSLNLDLTKSQFGGVQKEEQNFFDNRKTFKKSIRKISFKTEAVGTVWLNARRPSIKAELNLLKIKPNRNFIFNNKIYNHYKTTEKDEQFSRSSSNDNNKKNDNSYTNSTKPSKIKMFFRNAFNHISKRFNSDKNSN